MSFVSFELITILAKLLKTLVLILYKPNFAGAWMKVHHCPMIAVHMHYEKNSE
jgi:hypothetical protein